jgi:hypothetical protein
MTGSPGEPVEREHRMERLVYEEVVPIATPVVDAQPAAPWGDEHPDLMKLILEAFARAAENGSGSE